MTMYVGPSRDEMIWLTGRGGSPRNNAAGYFAAELLLLPVVAGCVAWMLLSGPSNARSRPKPAVTPIETALATPVPEIAPVEAASADGLKISSQSWRRGGLGSKALVTFTLRNSNDYAVRDIEISCTFTRRDGSHLTDRTRTIHDTVNMKSRKTFARMHIGFVNINADRAKCSPVTASRI